jgi:CRISPR/Cas system CMR-associated protein Cmr1 (group 7 of RAMP superfamily)
LFRAKILLDISRKRASTTAEKAHTLENLERRRKYWKEPYPLGMVGVDIDKVIDIDKASFKLEATNRNFGYIVREQRCNDTGVYGRGEKVTLLMGICSDRNVGQRWFEC